MMMKTCLQTMFRGVLITACLLLIAGCQSAATLSLAVRSGDTVLVGLSGDAGETITNSVAEVIRAEDLTASITDTNSNTLPVRVRNVFRVYGDPTANGQAANRGQWLAVIDLVDGANQALALATGPATLNLASNKLVDPLSVTTTILAGTGTPHPLRGIESGAEKLGFLEPAQQALVFVTGNPGSQRVGAVQYRFTVAREPVPTRLGLFSAIEGVKLQGRRDISFQSWTRANPGGGTDLYVIMTAPDGVAGSELDEFDMALLADLISLDPTPADYFSGSLQSATFYDVNGGELDGLQARVGAVQ